MWGVFKSIFRKKEPELPKEEIELHLIEKWLDEKTGPVVAELNSRLAAAKQAVAREIEETKHNLEVLEQAQLRNQSIPERAKHFMQGNRETYIKRIGFFLNSIHFPGDIRDYGSFYSAMQEELRNLAQGIARPYQILQEFFSDESRQVSSNIAVIEKELNSVQQEIISKSIHSLESTKLRIKDLEFKVTLKKKLLEESETLKQEKNGLEKEMETLSSELALLKKDKALRELEKKQLETKAKIEQAQARMMNSFSAIDTAMRKFEKITYKHREIMQKYIASPLDALMQDLHLGIIKALSDMQSTIRNSRIDLKDRKKDKALEVLQLFTKEYLGSFLTEYGQLKKEEGETAKAIETSNVTILVREKKEKLEKDESAKKITERKIADLQKEFEKIDIEALRADIAGALTALTSTAASIRL